MVVKYISLVLSGLLVIAVAAIGLSTLHQCKAGLLTLGSGELTGWLCLLLFTEACLGFAAGVSFKAVLATSGSTLQEARLAEWDRQDAKLKAEVRSDREKQLEAKIATLESALKAALKKK